MAKIKHTKNELKKQNDDLGRFRRYLPMLQLKKQQLQQEIVKIQHEVKKVRQTMNELNTILDQWIDVFSEDVSINNLIGIENIKLKTANIAGIDVPAVESIDFIEKEYDFVNAPLWVDYGIAKAKEMITWNANHQILKRQLMLLEEELKTTTQRVNLFENVKIPQAQDNIRMIRITLGDMQTVAVIRGKIAKDKIRNRESILSAS